METYRLVNIFETKGLEYTLLMCFLVLFILLVRYLTPAKPPVDRSHRPNRGASKARLSD